MDCNKVKVTYMESDGTIDYEILDLSDSGDIFDVVSVEAYYKEEEP